MRIWEAKNIRILLILIRIHNTAYDQTLPVTSCGECPADNLNIVEELGLLELPQQVKGIRLAHAYERPVVLFDHSQEIRFPPLHPWMRGGRGDTAVS